MTESPEPPLRLWDLPPELIEKLKTYRYDRIIEKHEGPERWEWKLRRPDERPSWAPAPVLGHQAVSEPDPVDL